MLSQESARFTMRVGRNIFKQSKSCTFSMIRKRDLILIVIDSFEST